MKVWRPGQVSIQLAEANDDEPPIPNEINRHTVTTEEALPRPVKRITVFAPPAPERPPPPAPVAWIAPKPIQVAKFVPKDIPLVVFADHRQRQLAAYQSRQSRSMEWYRGVMGLPR